MEILKLKDLENYKTKNINMFLYGASFSGKTRFATTWPKPIIISTDGNIKGLDEVNEDAMAVILKDEELVETATGQKIKKSGWLAFKELVDGLIHEDEIETIIVDIIKDVYDMMNAYVLKREGAAHESEIKQQGKIWKLFESEFLPVLRKLKTSNKNVVFIAHEKVRNEKTGPSTTNNVTQKLQSYVDINARLVVAGMPGQPVTRMLYLAPAAGQEGGNRLSLNEEPIQEPTYDKLIQAIQHTKKQ